MKKNIALIVSGIIFGLVALAHLLRLILKIEIIVAGNPIPMSVSYIGIVIALILSIWMFLASKN